MDFRSVSNLRVYTVQDKQYICFCVNMLSLEGNPMKYFTYYFFFLTQSMRRPTFYGSESPNSLPLLRWKMIVALLTFETNLSYLSFWARRILLGFCGLWIRPFRKPEHQNVAPGFPATGESLYMHTSVSGSKNWFSARGVHRYLVS